MSDGAPTPAPVSPDSTPLLVIVVAYRAEDLLTECLKRLAAAGCPVIVVDNSGRRRTGALSRELGLAYLDPGRNLGFAAGVNAGLGQAWDGRSNVVLINPDAVVGSAELAGLQAFLASDRRLAAVGPRLTDAQGRVQPADWPLPSPAQVWLDAVGLGRRLRGPRFVTGAVLLIRGSALAELGRFDERYFLYAEEADWQARAQRSGWRVAVCPDVTVTHVGAASSGDPVLRERQFQTSATAFARKWYGPGGAMLLWAGSVTAAVRRAVAGTDRRGARRALRVLFGRRRASSAPSRTVVQVVRSDAFAGVERYIADVSCELHRRGWQVTVIGGDPERMRQAMVEPVAYLPARTVAGVARALAGIGEASVVHAHMTAAELPAALFKHRMGARLVVTRHFAGPRGSTWAGRLSRRIITPRVDAQLAVSEFVASRLDEPATVLPDGVPDQPDRTDAGPDHHGRVVAIVQRLEPEKDTAVALRAWPLSGLAASGWTLSVHGEGSQSAALRSLAGDDPSISFGGFADAPLQVFAGADLVLATAPAEPFGLAVAEAMSAGAPVLAADGGAHPELLGPEGPFFRPGDAADCARALTELAADHDRRTALGRDLRERQRRLFSLARHVDALEEIYR